MEHSLVLKYLTCKPKILECFSTVDGMATQPSLVIISKNVAALREAKQWSQSELAKKAGVSQKVVSNLENADTLGIHPTFYTITSIAKALNVSLFVLMLPISLEKLLQIQKEPKLDRVIDAYLTLPDEGRVTVDRVLELESQAPQLPQLKNSRQLSSITHQSVGVDPR
jgi:transcriptional regulator with XRE-family HTH domain